jgi:hypothetical protein
LGARGQQQTGAHHERSCGDRVPLSSANLRHGVACFLVDANPADLTRPT